MNLIYCNCGKCIKKNNINKHIKTKYHKYYTLGTYFFNYGYNKNL